MFVSPLLSLAFPSGLISESFSFLLPYVSLLRSIPLSSYQSIFLLHKSHWRASNLSELETVPQDHPVLRGFDLMQSCPEVFVSTIL
jgi:hypothetical protein